MHLHRLLWSRVRLATSDGDEVLKVGTSKLVGVCISSVGRRIGLSVFSTESPFLCASVHLIAGEDEQECDSTSPRPCPLPRVRHHSSPPPTTSSLICVPPRGTSHRPTHCIPSSSSGMFPPSSQRAAASSSASSLFIFVFHHLGELRTCECLFYQL